MSRSSGVARPRSRLTRYSLIAFPVPIQYSTFPATRTLTLKFAVTFFTSIRPLRPMIAARSPGFSLLLSIRCRSSMSIGSPPICPFLTTVRRIHESTRTSAMSVIRRFSRFSSLTILFSMAAHVLARSCTGAQRRPAHRPDGVPTSIFASSKVLYRRFFHQPLLCFALFLPL